jgi:hypothetical protein
VTIEGFDLAAGKTLWSYDAGSDADLVDQTPPLIGPDIVALPKSGDRMVALNLATGKHRPVSSSAVGWCPSSVVYKTQVGYPSDVGGTTYQRLGASGFEPYTASGDTASQPSSVPSFAGVVVGGLTVTSDSSEVAATPR